MRIVCPSCQAAYEVPERLIDQAPRRLRCARCGHEWLPPELRAETPAVAPPPPGPPPSAPPPVVPPSLRPPARQMDYGEELDEKPPRRRVSAAGASNRVAVLGWLLSVLVLAMLGGAAVAWRGDIMAAWPPSQRVYVAVGLR
jgi:predicted Zn finger-like uncharacterized protein